MNSVDCVGAHSLRGALCVATSINRESPFLTVVSLLFGAILVFCLTVRAQAGQSRWHSDVYSDNMYAALFEYVEQLEPSKQIDASGPEALGAHSRLAEADNAFDALREFLKRHSEPAQPPPSATPKAVKPAPSIKSDVSDATVAGEKACLTCHVAQANKFHQTLMGRIDLAKATTRPVPQCETCHGPGSAHVKAGGGRGVGGIISFRANDPSRTPEDNNAICLGCHEKGERTYWSGSTHETRDLACTTCHTIMKRVSRRFQLKTEFEPDTCFQCHKDRRAQMFRSSHMPLREGKLVCTSCHNPHGSPGDSLLKEASVNDTCYTCHAEKRGPFLFEHTPVRENCLNCHNPHGSVNEFLLNVSRPRLCAQCHGIGHTNFLSGGPVQIGAFARACQNCHTQIHGSNSPSGALFQR